MKIITCASYYGTGSSAITDLIGECDNVQSLTDYEFRFISDPDGIRDLEYNLVENNHRHNSGYALKRYERNVKFLAGNKFIKKYNRFFGDKWVTLSNQYVKDLVDVEYKGAWAQDIKDLGPFRYFIERSINKVVTLFDKEKSVTVFLKNNTNYVTYPKDRFYDITKKYIEDLFSITNPNNKEYLMIDQLVPASNTTSYLKYFNDIKVICVDRDPRDLFLLEKKWNGTIIPKDVHQFCQWFKVTRAHKKDEVDDTSRILRIQFEDLIYHYDEYSRKVLDFCGISEAHHTSPKTLLDPSKSINNTQLWKKQTEYSEDIKVITEELKDYLYDFDKAMEK